MTPERLEELAQDWDRKAADAWHALEAAPDRRHLVIPDPAALRGLTPADFTAIGHTDCGHCGAPPDRACTGAGTGVHFMRVARAHRLGWIGDATFHAAMHQAVVFTAATVLHPEVSAA